MKKCKWLNIFLFYSILGNVFERIMMFLNHKDYVSGFMGTIFTPIYGIAMLLILFIHSKINFKNKFFKILTEFFIYLIVLTFLELVGGLLIENIFNKIFWNYDNFKYNLGKYIALEVSLLWGVLSIVILYVIHPLYIKLERYIPKLLTIVLSFLFLINLIYSFMVKFT